MGLFRWAGANYHASGLIGDNFGGYDTVDGERILFNPPLGLGESGTTTNVVPQQLLYNATVKR